MKNFEGFGLNSVLAASLARMNYAEPTPIQAQAIPLALDGHDIMGSAQTGTGKTAAFAIPLVEKLLNDPYGSALVLTPTRELGKQIMDIMHQLIGHKSPIKTAFIIGGEAMSKQYSQLRNRPRLIVGTPGRINDHLERGSLDLSDAHFLVLDETDRMLDMGFTIQLERIFEYMPEKRQTLMFSATLPKNILKMSERYMSNPKRIAVGETNVVAKNIKQEVIRIEQDKKYDELRLQLHERTGSVIVFVKTKHNADRMADKLRRDGFTSEALHGDLKQSKRDKVMINFRKQNFRILIATDIAARGLDVPHIEHVVNYDLPQVAEDFIHRMGRTARAGATGSAISFVSNAEGRKWHAIERLLDPNAANDSGYGRDDRSGGYGRKSGGRGKPASRGRSDFKGKGSFKDKAGSRDRFGSNDRFEKKDGFAPRNKFASRDEAGAGEDNGSRKSFGPRSNDRPNSDDRGNKRPFRNDERSAGGYKGGERSSSEGKPFKKTERSSNFKSGGFNKGDGFKGDRDASFNSERGERSDRKPFKKFDGEQKGERGNDRADRADRKPFNKSSEGRPARKGGKPGENKFGLNGDRPAHKKSGAKPFAKGKPSGAPRSTGKPQGGNKPFSKPKRAA